MIALPYLAKPQFGATCNGCGLCCALELCDVAKQFFPDRPAPCPALEYAGGRTFCGLVLHPSKYVGTNPIFDNCLTGLIQKATATGQGCGMTDDVED